MTHPPDTDRIRSYCEKARKVPAATYAMQALEDLPVLLDHYEAMRKERDELRRNRCRHCGSDRIYSGPPDCPTCGAPNCCQTCCKITALELRLSALEADRGELLAVARECDAVLFRVETAHGCDELTRVLAKDAAHDLREKKLARYRQPLADAARKADGGSNG